MIQNLIDVANGGTEQTEYVKIQNILGEYLDTVSGPTTNGCRYLEHDKQEGELDGFYY